MPQLLLFRYIKSVLTFTRASSAYLRWQSVSPPSCVSFSLFTPGAVTNTQSSDDKMLADPASDNSDNAPVPG